MQVVRLHFGSQEFVLPQDADVDGLRHRILEAAGGPADGSEFTPYGSFDEHQRVFDEFEL
jgi:hypothetical protein